MFTALAVSIGITACGMTDMDLQDEAPKEMEEVTDELIHEDYEHGVIFKTEQHPIEEYNEKGYLLMEGQYEAPQIIIDANPEAEEQIQAYLDKVMEAFYTDQEDNLILLTEQLQTMQGTGMHGSRYYDFALEEASDTFISMIVYDETFLGGAHGSHTTKGMTFDRNTGKYLMLEDIFEDAEAVKKEITEQILEQIKKKNEEGGTELFFPNYEENIALLLKEDPAALYADWYIKDGNLVIIANEYTLAAYAAGAFEFPIPLESLSTVR